MDNEYAADIRDAITELSKHTATLGALLAQAISIELAKQGQDVEWDVVLKEAREAK